MIDPAVDALFSRLPAKDREGFEDARGALVK